MSDKTRTTTAEDSPPSSESESFKKVHAMVLPDFGDSSGDSSPADSTSNRVVESSLPRRDHPLPVPNGWYAIVGSADLARGDIVSIVAVDRDLVVFRDETDQARVFDAHCPHLGAHLGGGCVVGETLKCPYHGWHFAAGGECVKIPYGESQIPQRARVRSYPVTEQDGFVYFWYHAADEPPGYELPVVSEVTDPDWTDAHEWRFELVAALQEMAENNVDYAHLRYVHRRKVVPDDTSEFFTDGPTSWVIEKIPGGQTFTRHSYGPGVALLRVPDIMTLLATTTPIDRGTCRLHWHFYFPEKLADAADDLIEGVTGPYGLQADIPIWRDKVYRDRPVLVKGDGPIAEFRRWYAQFYEGA